MDRARWELIQNIFHSVVDRPPSERSAALEKLCQGDESLAADVTRMLKEVDSDDSVLNYDFPRLAQELMDGSAVAAASARFGPYRLKELLGEGGMAVVWLAEREDLGSSAAIKILRDASLSPARRRLFAREQQTLAQLHHPSIAQLYDADTLSDGTPYFVMEYVEGKALADYCREQKSSIEQMLRLFRVVCEAVSYAHSQAIIHRDLKPSNILVKDDGSVKLLDFGIAKRIADLQQEQPTQTRTTPWLMTPAYAAPEQIRGEPAGTQADVYALGVILYELLAGRLPYDISNQTPGQVEHLIEQQEPVPPSALAKQASSRLRIGNANWDELDVLCLKAIHKDTRRRYASVEALIRDIDHYLKCEPLEAKPDSLLYRTRRFVSRRRVALTQAAVVLLVILALVGFFTVRLARARTRALAAAARTERIQSFMLTLFDGGDREAGPSNSLSAATLVDRGVLEARELNGDPQTQAALYKTLATIYQKLGKFDRAEPLLRSALALQKADRAGDVLIPADTMVSLGLLRIDQAQMSDGERLIRQALAIDQQKLPPGDPQTARTMSALGRALEERGAYNDAVAVLNDTVRMQSRRPADIGDLADSLNELAEVQYYLGHYDIADSLNRRTLAIDRQIYGTTHPRIADSLVNLGEIQHDLGHDADAEKYYREALTIKKSWYGEVHPDTATCMAAVGQSLVYQGKYDEAAPFLERALAIQEQVYGKTHPQVAIALNQVGVLELRRKRMDAALADFMRMAGINRVAYGDRHYLVGVALINVGEVYFEEHKLPEAEKYFRETLDRFVAQLPKGHPNIAIAQVKLGKTLVLEHQYRDAETYLVSGYETLIKMNPPPADRIESTRKDLMTVYDALHEPAKEEQYRGKTTPASMVHFGDGPKQ
ncbi:MAG: serine/threonine-protein kinase [Acidobacteriaceae bacterium]|jgi:serine/threonine protein kinase/tetratricopeptide (TPR) repeat protein